MSEYISVKVHPQAGKDILVSLGPGRFEAWVKAKPVAGRANDAVEALLARHLKTRGRLIKGGGGRYKVFRLLA